MTTVEFINKKNKILFDLTGIMLVPEDQIQECEQKELFSCNDVYCCPYCQVYYNYNCKGCPMHKAGNGCEDGSTYDQVFYRLDASICSIREIKELVEQYNIELKEMSK